MLLKIVCVLTFRVLSLVVLAFRGELAKDAELLVLRHGPRQARNLALSLGERFEDVKLLIRDRGSKFTASFDAVFQAVGTRVLRSAVQAPRMNAICERLAGTLRRELPGRMLILGETHLRATLAEYQVHYNTARPHQGIAQRVPVGEYDSSLLTVADPGRERIHRRAVLGGLINEYSRAALHRGFAGHLNESNFRAG